ncbi:MAG: hypothetical protein Q7T03_09070 [Deltaproteobacteria bacterium]|nr:hypothetical protein [Deltaproteobacteria bacterium]
MEHRHYKNVSEIPKPPAYVMRPSMHFLWLTFVVIGVVTFIFGLKIDANRAWHNYLLNYFYWMALGLSGVFFVALQHITSARWSVPFRRVPEAFVAYLPIAFILFLVLLTGVHSLYEWSHPQEVLKDVLLKGKMPYLNLPFFTGRNIVFLSVWMGTGFWFLKNSLRQDVSGSVGLTILNKTISAPFLVFFGISFTLASFDLLMSLEAHWFSTIFGVYCFAGLFQSGLAMMIVLVIALRRQGALQHVVNENHLHDLGKLMFAFTVFWAYIAFSQYMLIWYANLPEETGYLIRRTEGHWTPVALALLICKFVIPFFMLICRPAKRNENFLLFVALWILGAQWIDCYWMIYPLLGDKPVFGWQEIGLFLGFMGLFALSVTWILQRVQAVPMKDPRLLEGVNHHQ